MVPAASGDGAPGGAEDGGGVQSRGQYYDKWAGYTASAARELQQEEQAEKTEAERALGLGQPVSTATSAKVEALRAAKAQWQNRHAQELQAKHWVCDARDSTHTLDAAALGDKQVVHLRGCTGCTFTLPPGVVLAKLFVESCTSCSLHLHGRLLTGHLEVWASDSLTLHCSQPLGTLQADGCGSLVVEYERAEHLVAIVHADVASLQVHTGEHRARHDVSGGAAAEAGGQAPRKDMQFITRWVGLPPRLLTERIIRDATDYPTTARELLERATDGSGPAGDSSAAASDPDVLAAAACAVNDPRVADALQEAMQAKRAALQREEGNAAFRQGDWATAAVKYTASLDAQPGNSGVLSNRAAAFLKLGKADQAAADAAAALALDPGNVKAAFRHGLALHALGRFSDAGAALTRALAAEPGNAQIKDALRMTEFSVARERQRALETN